MSNADHFGNDLHHPVPAPLRPALIGALLIAITLAVFWQVHSFEFVNFDDPIYVSDNPRVRQGLTLSNISWSFKSSHASNWIPMTWVSLMIDASLFRDDNGLPDPAGFHITNLVLHCANVLLLLGFLVRLTGDVWKCGLVAALFAIHPLHVESVAWITERKDVLSTLFGLLAILAYSRYVERPRKRWYIAALVAFILSLLSKQMLVTLPLLLLLLDFWPLNRLKQSTESLATQVKQRLPIDEIPKNFQKTWGALVWEKLPFLFLSIAMSAVAFAVQQQGGAVQTTDQFSIGLRISNAVVVYVLYLIQAVLPRDLAIFYPYPSGPIPLLHVAGAALFLAAMTATALIFLRRHPYLAVGWFWYLITLLPVIGLVQIGSQRMADRYTYVPLIGPFIAVAWLAGAAAAGGLKRKMVTGGLAIAAVVALAVAARQQTGYWKNSITLFEHAIDVTHNNPTAHTNLGKAYSDVGRPDEAVAQYETALDIEPNHAVAHNNLGYELTQLGKDKQAMEHFREAIRIDPRHAMARFNLAMALRKQSKNDDALAELLEAHRLDLESTRILVNLGSLLREMGKLDEAIEHYKAALLIDPHFASARMNLGIALFSRGHFDKGMSQLRWALELSPRSAASHHSLGVALYAQRKFDDAVFHFRKALELDPQHSEAQISLSAALTDLGVDLAKNGNLNKGIFYFKEALRLSADSWRTHYYLALVLMQKNESASAEQHLSSAVKLNPEQAEIHNTLGKLLLKQGRKQAAVKSFQEAVRLKPDFEEAKKNLERLKQQ